MVTIGVGDVIFYRLKPSDLPRNQEKVWKGLIENVYPSFIFISSLDEGYEGLCEPVWFSQVIKVERRIDHEE